MPLSIQDIFDLPSASLPVRIALEPARSAVQSLLMLTKGHQLAGVADWVVDTVQVMSPQERKTNELVLLGLHYVVLPRESWNSFPAYVDHLAEMKPEDLRDKMLAVYEQMPVGAEAVPISLEQALSSPEDYLAYLGQRFESKNVNEVIERQSYRLVMDPPALQRLVVDHLRHMWNRYLSAEWERVRPMLREVVQAYQQVDLKGKSFIEAGRIITGQLMEGENWASHFTRSQRVVFVPHPHVGPYLPKCFSGEGELVIFFRAHLPEGMAVNTPDLSRTEIFLRLSALADDNRLRILRYIAEHGEQRSQAVMDALELSQSAASRHLTQLSAAGFLNERRCDGAKCYALNPERITDTLQAIAYFLLVSERSA